jgi:hypothetical protein
MEKKYPIGGYAPGNYECTCATCDKKFQGDKQAVQCEACAIYDKERFDAMTQNEQKELLRRNSMIAHLMFVYAGAGDQIVANQLSGMPLEEAIFQAGYSAGVDFQKERTPTCAVWVKASEFKYEARKSYYAKWLDGKVKATGWFQESDGTFFWNVPGYVPILKHEHEYLHILDESAATDDWISVDEQLPIESGRYWCYVKEVTDLGFSYFQWNCAYNAGEKRFSDSTLTNGENVTHWRPLPSPPNPTPNGLNITI